MYYSLMFDLLGSGFQLVFLLFDGYGHYIAEHVDDILDKAEEHLGEYRYRDQLVRLQIQGDDQYTDHYGTGLVRRAYREEQYQKSDADDLQPRDVYTDHEDEDHSDQHYQKAVAVLICLREDRQLFGESLSAVTVFSRAVSDVEGDRVDSGVDLQVLPHQRGKISDKVQDVYSAYQQTYQVEYRNDDQACRDHEDVLKQYEYPGCTVDQKQ